MVLFHHESFSRGDDEVDEEKNRRNMHRDMTYEKHQSLRNMTLSIVRFLRRRRITTDSR
ncbi:MAG: hypothetical protein ACLS9K_09555 [Lachnospira eligens]